MENACMKTLPNTKLPRPRWRTPWSLPSPIESSTGSPTGLGIGAAPLCTAATVRSHSRGVHMDRPVLRAHVVPTDTTTTSTEAANVPLLSHMRRLPKEDPTTAPPNKPTTGVPNNQPLTTGTPSNPPPTLRPHHRSSRPENSRASEPSFHRADSFIKHSGCHTTQTQTQWGEVSCTLQWSLSGHQHVCISNSQEAITQATKENLKWKMFTN